MTAGARLGDLLQTARAAARAAADLLAGARPSEVRGKSSPRDLVTEWDLRTEEAIRRVLLERERGIPILGEEGGLGAADGQAGGLRWLVDPIDGTVNFAHGLPIFAVSVGFEEAGCGVAGAVVAPALGWRFAAARGEGATLNGAAIGVSAIPTLGRAMLVTGFPYDRALSADNNFAAWEHMQRRAGAVRRLGAASLDLCFVAAGWLDGYWEIKLKPWDIAAGAVICAEAGGRVTAIDGGPFASDAGTVVASNGLIHDELVAELAALR